MDGCMRVEARVEGQINSTGEDVIRNFPSKRDSATLNIESTLGQGRKRVSVRRRCSGISSSGEAKLKESVTFREPGPDSRRGRSGF